MTTVQPSQSPKYWANWHASREDIKSEQLELKKLRNREWARWLERNREGLSILFTMAVSASLAIAAFAPLTRAYGVNTALGLSTLIAAVASVAAVTVGEIAFWGANRHLDRRAERIQGHIDQADQTALYYERLGSCVRPTPPRHLRG